MERGLFAPGHDPVMGPYTADYLGMADQIGTLEAGKLADIVL
jgi:hypothetical protein